MSDLNDLTRPVTTDTEPNVLDTLRAHILRAATWAGYASTANKVAGLMSAVTAAVTGGRSMRLYRRNDANTADEEVVSLPGISVGGNAASASAAQSGSTLETALAAKAPLNNAALTGVPIAPTAAVGTNTAQLATTAFVAQANAALVGSAPEALNTLNEFAAALGNDPNFATSTATAIGNRVVKTSATRPGVTKLYRNDSDSDYSVQNTWQADRAGYWSLRGYSGDTYHAGVFVAYSGYADTAGSAPASDVYAWAKAASKPSYSYGEISGTPSSLPASDVYSWAKALTRPTYSAADVGLGSVNNTADSSKDVNSATKLSTATGSAPSYAARAWVNFNGTGTVAIRASGNVMGITDNGVGDYTVNFSAAMPDANFSTLINGAAMPNNLWDSRFFGGDYTTNTASKANLVVYNGSGRYDNSSICVQIIR